MEKFHSAVSVSIYKADVTFHLNKFFAEVGSERLKSGFSELFMVGLTLEVMLVLQSSTFGNPNLSI